METTTYGPFTGAVFNPNWFSTLVRKLFGGVVLYDTISFILFLIILVISLVKKREKEQTFRLIILYIAIMEVFTQFVYLFGICMESVLSGTSNVLLMIYINFIYSIIREIYNGQSCQCFTIFFYLRLLAFISR